MPALEAKGVSRHFGGVQALQGVSLAIDAGELVAVIGPNGAGKSTLFNVLTGVTPASGGSVVVAGEEVTDWPPFRIARAGVARTLQVPRPFRELTVLENLLVALDSESQLGWVAGMLRPLRAGREERGRRAQAMELLEEARLARLADSYPEQLPFGLLQRLEMVRALATRPRVLLLDEPGADLEGSELDAMVTTIEGIRAEGVAVLWIEHHLDLVLRTAPRIHVLANGQSLTEGTPEAVMADRRVQEAYVGVG